ncbi:hypothetical protein MMC22_003404 [Lobaria immixta]|nr:hypothetical protein [Lobaria immixta]
MEGFQDSKQLGTAWNPRRGRLRQARFHPIIQQRPSPAVVHRTQDQQFENQDEEYFQKMFAAELRQIKGASKLGQATEPPHRLPVETKSASTHRTIRSERFETEKKDLGHETGCEKEVDEPHRDPDAGFRAQMGLSEDCPNASQKNPSKENTRDSTPGTHLNQKRAIRKGTNNSGTKGQVREVVGGIEYYSESNHSWHSAVYHEDIRGELLLEASLLGQYDHPQKRVAPNDVTSYLPSQKEWGANRVRNWPEILHRLEQRELRVPDYKVGDLYYNGRIVLDIDNHPVLDYVDLPATLSTEFSGLHMEAIARLDPRISHNDFRVRMPRTRQIGRDGRTLRPSPSLSAIGMRMTRFRQQNGLLSWTRREGSKNISGFMMSRLPQENIVANSTRGVLPPSLVEQADARDKNKGQYAARAGGRALSETARRERDDKESAKLAKLRAVEDQAKGQDQAQLGTKRKRTNHASPDTSEMELTNKRRKPSDPSQILRPVVEMPVLPPLQPDQSTPAPQSTRKRSREASCPEKDDEYPAAKRPCRRCTTPIQRVEKEERAMEVDDKTTFNDASGEESAGVGDVPTGLVAQEASMVPPVLKHRVDAKEPEGASPLEFPKDLTSEELEENTLAELLQRELERMGSQETEEVAILRQSFY